jgi:predicted transposase YdaD
VKIQSFPNILEFVGMIDKYNLAYSEKKTEGKGRQYKEERGKKRERMQLKENGRNGMVQQLSN